MMKEEEKMKKAVDALYSALTCVWDDNGNIMAEAVRDYVTGTLVKLTGKTMLEVEATLERKIEEAQTRQVF